MLEQALASSNIKTANTREKANKKEVKSKLAASKKTEAGSVVECEECKNKELEELKLVSQKALNLRTCNIISHKRNSSIKLMMSPHERYLIERKLSDYWAQELVEMIKIAGGTGEVGLPLLERGFETGNPDLQEVVMYSAGEIGGEPALSLLERGFETGNPELQKEVLRILNRNRNKTFVVRIFRKILKNPNLDENIKKDINRKLTRLGN